MKIQFTTHRSKLSKFAFTLAETLIVIGIIGVVAALTLPNLNHATGDKEKVTKVKKIYSALVEARDRAEAIYGPETDWLYSECKGDYSCYNELYPKRITEFLKVSKKCENLTDCFSSAPYLDADGSTLESSLSSSHISDSDYQVILSDGMSIAFGSGLCRIMVDIDGPKKGKNQWGNDIFEFYTDCYDEKNPEVWVPDIKPSTCHPDFESSIVENVTAWVIENGNLDYLKCPDDLDWDTQTSCK